jgi:hypothetical protein
MIVENVELSAYGVRGNMELVPAELYLACWNERLAFTASMQIPAKSTSALARPESLILATPFLKEG